MDATIRLGDAGLILIGLALLVLLIYCISLVRNLIPVVKNLNRILSDSSVISGIAAENAKEADTVIHELTASLSSVAKAIKGNQSIIASFAQIAKAAASLKNLLEKFNKNEKD